LPVLDRVPSWSHLLLCAADVQPGLGVSWAYASMVDSNLDRPFDAVLFDWCGTLVEYPLAEDPFRPALQRLGRPHDDQSITELVAAFEEADRHPAAVESDKHCESIKR
jgi:hypothetical protein